MKFTKTDDVLRDRETGVCYTREHQLYPIAVIDGAGKSTTFGVMLTPYGGHEAVEWDGEEMIEAGANVKAKFGFIPQRWGQDILVTEEQLATRFESLGRLSKEVDLEAVVRQYSEECVDFTYRQGVIKAVTRQLQRMVPAMWACEIYTLLKDYIAHTPGAPGLVVPPDDQG
jgi:hypothetical protein